MTEKKVQERNAEVREKMLDLQEVSIGPMPASSPWIRPVRMTFLQNGREKVWDLMRSHDSVSMVIFNTTRKKLVFVRQFRPASYVSCLPEIPKVDVEKYPATLGLTLELCAGIIDKDKPIVEIAKDELREECGYEAPASAFTKLQTYRYIACLATRQTLFYVEVTDDMHVHPGGGDETEGELIEVVEMSVPEVKTYISSEEIHSPPCFLYGVTWFLANKIDRYC